MEIKQAKYYKYSTLTQENISNEKGKNLLVKPFLKWAGGKRQLIKEYRKYIPTTYGNYFEPFVGAGAILFYLQPKSAIISDKNEELINCYMCIKENVDELLTELRKHYNDEDYFYQIRDLDRQPLFSTLTLAQRAARIIFLNKTCFNGLFRVNSQGQFNVPYGNYESPNFIDEVVLKAVSNYMNSNLIKILNCDFSVSLESTQANDFVYLDPPYDPISETSSFTGYNLDRFGKEDQKRLKEYVDLLTEKKCKVMLSNSSTEFILNLYSDKKYTIIRIPATRNINSVSNGRGKIDELIILNYNV